MDLESKRAILETNASLGSKLFSLCITGSVFLPMLKPELAGVWKVLIPLGIAGLALSFLANGKLGDDRYNK